MTSMAADFGAGLPGSDAEEGSRGRADERSRDRSRGLGIAASITHGQPASRGDLRVVVPWQTMRRVLVVEDSVSTRAFVRTSLEDDAFASSLGGCEVVEAASGFEAMRLLPRASYDLIITDINMTDINGLELIAFIRKSEHHRSTPLIIISTQSTERDIERGIALGANAYLPKPFTVEELREVSRPYLQRDPGAAAPVPAPLGPR